MADFEFPDFSTRFDKVYNLRSSHTLQNYTLQNYHRSKIGYNDRFYVNIMFDMETPSNTFTASFSIEGSREVTNEATNASGTNDKKKVVETPDEDSLLKELAGVAKDVDDNGYLSKYVSLERIYAFQPGNCPRAEDWAMERGSEGKIQGKTFFTRGDYTLFFQNVSDQTRDQTRVAAFVLLRDKTNDMIATFSISHMNREGVASISNEATMMRYADLLIDMHTQKRDLGLFGTDRFAFVAMPRGDASSHYLPVVDELNRIFEVSGWCWIKETPKALQSVQIRQAPVSSLKESMSTVLTDALKEVKHSPPSYGPIVKAADVAAWVTRLPTTEGMEAMMKNGKDVYVACLYVGELQSDLPSDVLAAVDTEDCLLRRLQDLTDLGSRGSAGA